MNTTVFKVIAFLCLVFTSLWVVFMVWHGIETGPVETLEKARNTAQKVGLRYVYLGNVPGHEGNHTYCPHCERLIVRRAGMSTAEMHIVDGRCKHCQAPIAGVWQ